MKPSIKTKAILITILVLIVFVLISFLFVLIPKIMAIFCISIGSLVFAISTYNITIIKLKQNDNKEFND
jgi:hypothetical protein